MIQQGRLFSSVSKFVLNNLRREILLTNQIVSANSTSLIGRYLENQLDVYWTTVSKCVVLFVFIFQRIETWIQVKKTT